MSKVSTFARGFSTFVNWFNGAAAVICGIWMMLSALIDMPLSWNDWMPLSIYDPFPLHDVFFTSHFWPGLALLLVNGAPNIAAIVAHHRRPSSWLQWCLLAGVLLIAWTAVELVVIPNGLSVFYLVVGIFQTTSAAALIKLGVQQAG